MSVETPLFTRVPMAKWQPGVKYSSSETDSRIAS